MPRNGGPDRVVVTLQKSLMGTSEKTWDIFSGLSTMQSGDGGKTWSEPKEEPGLRGWREPDGTAVVVSDFTPQWHAATGKLLGLGHTCRYREGQLMPPPRPRETAYSVFDADAGRWEPVEILDMGDADRFFCAGAGSIQWTELPGGDLLAPIYFKDKKTSDSGSLMRHASTKVLVMRCRFDGRRLRIVELGNELSVPAYRGIGEPSLVECDGRFWMTLRNGERAYASTSEDGLHFEEPVPWVFDDGTEIGSYDTQQHWARVGSRLFLVYTRKGLDNGHVVRHRAPLLMAEVDQARGCLLRASERIVVPNRGAQLGNFGVAQKSSEEAWICVSEWMENAGEWDKATWSALESKFPDADLKALEALPGRCGLCEVGGSDNSIYLVKVSGWAPPVA